MLKNRKLATLSVAISSILLLTASLRAKAAWHGEPEWEEYIEYCCNEFDCMELRYVVESLIFYESSWQPDAHNITHDCRGLMQVNPSAHKDVITKDTDLFQPYDNIYVGVEVLNQYWLDSESITEALNRYNGQKTKNETNYSKKILKLAKELEEEEHGKRCNSSAVH